jgi:uncharacterized membrane protein
MPKKKVVKKSVKKNSKKVVSKSNLKNSKTISNNSIVKAFVATFFSIFGFLIALIFWRRDDYAIFYAKQSMVLFIEALVVALIGGILTWVPIIGGAITFVLNLVIIILWVLTWVYALSGKKKKVFLVGNFVN